MGRLWGVLAPLGIVLEASWGPLGRILGRLGGVLGASWRIFERLGVSWGVLEPSWRRLDPLKKPGFAMEREARLFEREVPL